MVLSGSVEISKTIRGKKSILSVLGPGEVFGELGYLGHVKRTATVRAVGVIARTFLDREFKKSWEDNP